MLPPNEITMNCELDAISLRKLIANPECCFRSGTIAEFGDCCAELFRGIDTGCYENPWEGNEIG